MTHMSGDQYKDPHWDLVLLGAAVAALVIAAAALFWGLYSAVTGTMAAIDSMGWWAILIPGPKKVGLVMRLGKAVWAALQLQQASH